MRIHTHNAGSGHTHTHTLFMRTLVACYSSRPGGCLLSHPAWSLPDISPEVRQPQLFVRSPVCDRCIYSLPFVHHLGVIQRGNRGIRDVLARWAALGKEPQVPYSTPWSVFFKNLQSLSRQRSQPTTIPSGRARWSGGAFRAPPVCLPVSSSLWAQETNKSVAQQIWILTCFAGHPSLISVSPSNLLLPTIGRHASQGKLSI